jgi:tRNA G18 (ribose-2'-O)-methylase SpoU
MARQDPRARGLHLVPDSSRFVPVRGAGYHERRHLVALHIPTHIPISDPDDPRLSPYRSLPDPALADRDGLFVAEGRMVVERLLRHPTLRAQSVMVTAPALEALAPALVAHDALPVFVVTPRVMESVAGFDVHRGALALGVRPAPRDWGALISNARRVVALERVANADNVGGIFRAAAALGADAVLLGPSCADPLYRKAIRTSMAATMVVPFASAEPLPSILRAMGSAGWTTIALTPSPHADTLDDVARDGAGTKQVLVVGHEGDGLLPDTMDACARRARIPMTAAPEDLVDSLNVATATAVALYALGTADGARKETRA